MSQTWSPDTYGKFAAERFAPFDDLVALVHVRPHLRVIDLGCGTGELTERLAERLPDADVLGIDNSREMLERARPRAREHVRFELRPIETFEGTYDLIFSNAALHWIDDHPQLVARLLHALNPGGQLVAQFPSRDRPAAYATIAAVATSEPFNDALCGWQQPWPVLAIDTYADLLQSCGVAEQTVFEKVYPHVLRDADAIVDWQRGTAPLPYLERLPHEMRPAFEERLREEMRRRYPQHPVFFPFRRTFIAATIP